MRSLNLILIILICFFPIHACRNKETVTVHVTTYEQVGQVIDTNTKCILNAVVEIGEYEGKDIVLLHPSHDGKLKGMEFKNANISLFREKINYLNDDESLIINGVFTIHHIPDRGPTHPLYDTIASCEVAGEYTLDSKKIKLAPKDIPSKFGPVQSQGDGQNTE